MSHLYFTDDNHQLFAYKSSPAEGSDEGAAFILTAYNNVDSHSAGKWPSGTYQFAWWNEHKEMNNDPHSAYGTQGNFIFSVESRPGMGIHAGRAGVPDGLGRIGPQHATFGCIRTDEEGMKQLRTLHAADPIKTLHVGP